MPRSSRVNSGPRTPLAASRWAAHGAIVVMMAVAACGGGAGGAPPPEVAPAPGGSSGSAPAGSAPAGASSAAGGGHPINAGPGNAPNAASPAPTTPVEMKPTMPTAMADDLRALGLDANHLPPIEKLEPRTLRGVMKLMAKSLGVKCGDCHQEGDFAAPTRRKKIAAHMWDEFAAKLVVSGGSGGTDAPLFCDSCHQGRTELLDRRDKKALSKWMDDNFVTKLDFKAKASGHSVECETCHVDMDMHFLTAWGAR